MKTKKSHPAKAGWLFSWVCPSEHGIYSLVPRCALADIGGFNDAQRDRKGAGQSVKWGFDLASSSASGAKLLLSAAGRAMVMLEDPAIQYCWRICWGVAEGISTDAAQPAPKQCAVCPLSGRGGRKLAHLAICHIQINPTMCRWWWWATLTTRVCSDREAERFSSEIPGQHPVFSAF